MAPDADASAASPAAAAPDAAAVLAASDAFDVGVLAAADAPRVLDLRTADAFASVRVGGSANIPFADLSGRLHELPPRSRAMVVVLAEPDASVPSDADQAAVFFAEIKGRPNAWNVRAFLRLPRDRERLALAGVAIRRGAVAAIDRAHLWEPSDMIARWLPRLEREMAREWGAERAFARAGSPSPSSSAAAAADGDPEASSIARPVCVDLGSGAGRDAVWAARRGWRVVALDSCAKSTARCAALAETHGVGPFVHARRVDLSKIAPAEIFALARRAGEDAELRASSAPPPVSGSSPNNGGTHGVTNERANTLPRRDVHVRAVIAVRYLRKELAAALPALLPASAAVCWFHFARGAEKTAVGRPNRARDLLEPGELRGWFGEARGFRALADGVAWLPDGRPVSEFVAVKDTGGEARFERTRR